MIGERNQVQGKASAGFNFAPSLRASTPTIDVDAEFGAPMLAPRKGHRFQEMAVVPKQKQEQARTPQESPEETKENQAASAPTSNDAVTEEEAVRRMLDDLTASSLIRVHTPSAGTTISALIVGARNLLDNFDSPQGPKSEIAAATLLTAIYDELVSRAASPESKNARGVLISPPLMDLPPEPWTPSEPTRVEDIRIDEASSLSDENRLFAPWLVEGWSKVALDAKFAVAREAQIAATDKSVAKAKPKKKTVAAKKDKQPTQATIPEPSIPEESLADVPDETAFITTMLSPAPDTGKPSALANLPEVSAGVKQLEGVTVTNALNAVSANSSKGNVKAVPGPNAELKLWDAVQNIIHINQHATVLDRSGNLAGERLYYILKSVPPAGTYFAANFTMGVKSAAGSSTYSGECVFRVNGGMQLVHNTIVEPLSWLQDKVPLQEIERSALNRLEQNESGELVNIQNGIAIVVSNSKSVPGMGALDKLTFALLSAPDYLWEAIKTKARTVYEHPGEEVLNVAQGILLDIAGSAAAELSAVLGGVMLADQIVPPMLVAAYANSMDEVDFAAQAFARLAVEMAVSEMETRGSKKAYESAGKKLSSAGAEPTPASFKKQLEDALKGKSEAPRDSSAPGTTDKEIPKEPSAASTTAEPTKVPKSDATANTVQPRPTENMMSPPPVSETAQTTPTAAASSKSKTKLKSKYQFEKTPADLFAPPKGATPAVSAAEFTGDPRSVQALEHQLSQGLIAAPAVETPILFGKHEPYGPRTTDSQLALKTYSEAVSANVKYQGYEVGLYYNPTTREYQVNIGDGNSVGAPPGGDWLVVIHFHPNENTALSFRLPSPQDFDSLVKRMSESNPTPRSFVEYPLPQFKNQRGVTEFGYDPTNPKPFYVKVTLPNGETNIVHFYDMKEYAAFLDQGKKYLDPDSEPYKQLLEGEPAPDSQAMMSGDKNGERVTQENLEQVTDELSAIGAKYPKFLKEQANLKYNKIVADLKQTPGKSARYVESFLPKIWATIRDPKNFAALISEIQTVRETITAADKSANPGLTEDTIAVLKIAQERGIEVQIISPDLGEIQDFIGQVVAKPQAFLDMNAAALFPGHGATPHLMQEIIVDRLLKPLGSSASEFRLALGDLQASNQLGARIWAILFDPQYLDVNKPEALFPAIKKWLPNLQ